MGKQCQAAETCKASSVPACLTRCFTADNPPAQLPASGKKLRLKDGLRAPAWSQELHWLWDELEGCLLSLLTASGHKAAVSPRVVLQMGHVASWPFCWVSPLLQKHHKNTQEECCTPTALSSGQYTRKSPVLHSTDKNCSGFAITQICSCEVALLHSSI